MMFLLLIGRLVDLQIVRADHFRRQAEQSLLRRPRFIPFARGRILDRRGEVLVSDEPSWDIRVDYGIIAADFAEDRGVRIREAKRHARSGRYASSQSSETAADLLQGEMRATWRDIEECTGSAPRAGGAAIRAQAREVYDRVTEIRKTVAQRRGFDSPVAEEMTSHPVVMGLNRSEQIAARQRLAGYPWVSVEASTRRTYWGDATPFGHVLGRIGRVSGTHLADDPEAYDPFSRYLTNDSVGISGVEAAAEQALRGRRGRITLDRTGSTVEELIEPEPGQDVTLTLHAELQRRLYQLLGQRVRSVPESSGGAIVVLDVASREVLALVSYPAYDPSRWDELFPLLRDDTDRMPLSFRAVASRYAPGSILKPLVCLAGLINQRIQLDTREECLGYLDPQKPDRRRCWEIHGTNIRKAHGSIDVVEALTGSCNVFLYRVGERLGVDALCSAFDMVGIGRTTGIGLREENFGINPTPEWLLREKGTGVYPAHAWNFAIGQGEIAVTPLQAANLSATYASGRYRHVALIRDEATRPEWRLPGTTDQWLAIRRGIYGVVNDPDGTAHDYARLTHDRFCLCGKTGSATAHSWPTAYRIPFVDATGVKGVATIRAGAKGPACERFEIEYPSATYDPTQVTLASTWPRDATPESAYSHAWFAGYLQAIGPDGRPIWAETPRVAFAALIEFGGSGGRITGPLARDVAKVLIDCLDFETLD